ncbi:chemotaxis protein CheA [Sulfurimonas sp.]|nr:chemotaxis protein CheA [Sulfurimonas sp.]
MSDDLQLFDEDAQEQLDFMEAALVNMQDNGVNDDDIGALFRSMHTIKGTAGMFGFDDVVGFAHIAENLLSDVREGKVVLTEPMVEIFLLSKDHTSKLISLAIDSTEMPPEVKEANDELLSKLSSYLPSSLDEIPSDETKEHISAELDSSGIWHLSMQFAPDFFTSGMDILNLISFLEDMGNITHRLAQDEKVPLLKDIEPTQTYIGFQLILESENTIEDIQEVFEFVEDDMELDIFETNDINSLNALVDKMPKPSEFKEKLISEGFYYEEDFTSVAEETLEIPEELPTEPVEEVSSPAVEKNDKPQAKVEKKTAVKNFSLRVDSSKVDNLINQISEMVIANARIIQKVENIGDTDLNESAVVMGDLLEEIRSSVMNIRMVQVGDSFSKFRRIVNDTAKKIGKDIEFVINGGDTELDKMVIEKISDPLMHMLRNSVDHGVEMPNDREQNGKDRKGHVSLSAYPDAGMIVIEIKDDGKGLDRNAILAKAIKQGVVSENDKLSDKDIYNLVFEAGLSTAKEVSDISGRGVGMDVVKRNIKDLRGTIDIDSKLNEGTIFTIKLPLTLAIIDGFLIQVGKTKYIIPLEMIQECIELNAAYKEKMNGNQFINLRDNILPLLDVRSHYNEEESDSTRENVVVVQYGDYQMGILVDELFGEFQTVIKPLGDIFSNVPGISGGTILGTGDIGLIFDIPKLMEHKIRQASGL